MVDNATPTVAGQRLFFAMLPDTETISRIERIQRKLNIRGRAVKASQFHVTLVFLGMQPVERLPSLRAIASGLDMPACTVAVDCLGSFHRAGVAWLGASKLPLELVAFQARLAARLEQAQIQYDHRPWKFHLTLYRDLRTTVGRMQPNTVNWHLDGFSLMESSNTGNGVEYRQLGRWKAW